MNGMHSPKVQEQKELEGESELRRKKHIIESNHICSSLFPPFFLFFTTRHLSRHPGPKQGPRQVLRPCATAPARCQPSSISSREFQISPSKCLSFTGELVSVGVLHTHPTDENSTEAELCICVSEILNLRSQHMKNLLAQKLGSESGKPSRWKLLSR